jgi:hypothetical protein|eukprot:g2298.t1.1.5e174189.1.5e1746aa g2298  g2298.t1 contig11:1116676-1117311(+)
MKRVPAQHSKSPVSKKDKVPDFYELAKVSPLPGAKLSYPANGNLFLMNPGGMPSVGELGGRSSRGIGIGGVASDSNQHSLIKAVAHRQQLLGLQNNLFANGNNGNLASLMGGYQSHQSPNISMLGFSSSRSSNNNNNAVSLRQALEIQQLQQQLSANNNNMNVVQGQGMNLEMLALLSNPFGRQQQQQNNRMNNAIIGGKQHPGSTFPKLR